MPDVPTPTLMAFFGVFLGLVVGAVARGARFCTFGAVEDAVLAGNMTRLRSWALAIAFATLLVQTMHVSDIARIGESFHLTPTFGWAGAIIGGLLFGLGMALVGTCGYGSLIRMGGGDLKSFIVFILMGLTAYMTARGFTGVLRETLIEPLNVDLSAYDGQGLPHLISGVTGLAVQHIWLPTAIAVASLIGFWCFSDPVFRSSRRDILAALVIGSVVAGGYWVTGVLGNNAFDPQRVESLTYVLPPGETIVYLLTFSGSTIDFGIGVVFGTVIGAFLVAVAKREVRLEAFDDAREMRRHLLGAFLMGFGGVTALGCTIGQGISGMATLSMSAPLALGSILIGATFGLFYLVTGSISEAQALLRQKFFGIDAATNSSPDT